MKRGIGIVVAICALVVGAPGGVAFASTTQTDLQSASMSVSGAGDTAFVYVLCLRIGV